MGVIQKIIKVFAIAFAVFLTFTIVTAIAGAVYVLAGTPGKLWGIGRISNMETVSFSETYSKERIQNEEITSISVSCSCKINIVKGDELKVDVVDVPETYRLECRNGQITIKDEKKNGFINFSFFSDLLENSVVTITVPEDFVAKLIKIDSGSGKVRLLDVSCQKLVIDSGSGSVEIQNLETEQTDLDTGSGSVQISDSALGSVNMDSGSGRVTMTRVTAENMDVQSGSGKIDYIGVLSGNCRFESGSGSITMKLTGREEDYSISVESGSGGCYLNGKKVKDGTYGRGTSGKLLFDSGSGRITVEFEN